MDDAPAAAAAALGTTRKLVTVDGQVLHVLPGSHSGYDDGAPCSG
jgi:hypothetical protein